ncbi:MAG: SLC13 family permease [Candidatus Hydrogenedentota bacterium]
MEEHAHDIETWKTLIFLGLLAAMVLALALEEKIHAKKSLITGTFAIVCVLLADIFGLLPIGHIINAFGEEIHIPVYIIGIEWEVIAIIVGASLFVDVTSRSGLFTWIALKLTKASKGDPVKLLISYGILTVVFSAFLNNVTAMIIVGSLTTVSLKKLDRTSLLLGFLIIEGSLTNVGGLLTLISSVPNIIIGSTAGISFIEFFMKSAPYVVVATIATIWLGKRLFKVTSFATEEERAEAAKRVESFDENDGIKSQRFFYFSAVSFVCLIGLFATCANIPYLRDLGLGFIAISFALMMLWTYKHEVDEFYSGLDWDLIWFFMTLFVVINTMEHARVLALIGTGIESVIGLGDTVGAAGLLWCSAIASSVTDNIPLAAVLTKVLDLRATPADSTLWWSVIFGANLGGNLTPIGSASTVVAVTVMQKNKLGMTFVRFVKLSFPLAMVQLVLATFFVLLIIPLFS